jgi:hypothetical protein
MIITKDQDTDEVQISGAALIAAFEVTRRRQVMAMMKEFRSVVGDARPDIAIRPVIRLALLGDRNAGKTTTAKALIRCWTRTDVQETGEHRAREVQKADKQRPQRLIALDKPATFWIRHYDAQCDMQHRLRASLVPNFWEQALKEPHAKGGLDIVEHPQEDYNEVFDFAVRIKNVGSFEPNGHDVVSKRRIELLADGSLKDSLTLAEFLNTPVAEEFMISQ